MEHNGYILIADITGYTVYLNESELDHARGTLSSLLELLIEHTKPPLVIAGLEGDAVFSYGLEDGFVEPQTLLETIESTYLSFREAIELMVLNNSCQCSACANVSSLDLKFFLHYGTFALETIGSGQELIGRDVNLIHRLLKNSVTEETGIRAYLLCTQAALERLDLDVSADEMLSIVEDVPDFGEVTVWIRDMHPIHEDAQDSRAISFEESETIFSRDLEIALPPQLLWDYLAHSQYRNLIWNSERFEVTKRRSGRIDEGTVYECYHGDHPVPQIVLEWRPFESIVIKQANPVPGPVNYIHIGFALSDTDDGTILSVTCARPTGRIWQRALAWTIYKTMDSALMERFFERLSFGRNLDRFRNAIERDASARLATSSMGASSTTDASSGTLTENLDSS